MEERGKDEEAINYRPTFLHKFAENAFLVGGRVAKQQLGKFSLRILQSPSEQRGETKQSLAFMRLFARRETVMKCIFLYKKRAQKVHR